MSIIQDKIYPVVPILAQNLIISSYGYYWRRRRFGGIFNSELKKFKERESFTIKQWKEYQEAELRKLLVHAYLTVPFYNAKYSEIGISLKMLSNFKLEELPILPSINKSDLRKFGTTAMVSNLKQRGRNFYSSSGSTGTPTKILFSAFMHQKWSAAFEARIRNWAGITRKNSRGIIGGRRVVPHSDNRGPFHRYNYFEKQVYFSAYHISPSTVEEYANTLKKYKLDYMTGYAMSNYFLAKLIHEAGLKVPHMKAVITSSEKLTSEMREIFVKVYGCKTYDSYSGVEACGLISENEYGQLLISPDIGIMEILNDNGMYCSPGEIGEICSTGLLNFDQPLIRYRIGDYVKLAKDQNTLCGRNFVVAEEIIGRIEDTIIGKDGRKIVRFHGIFIDLPSVIEGQIIQHSLTDFEIKVVVSQKISENESLKLRQRMESQLGEINLLINEVNHIPRNPNGKFIAVISKVKVS